MEKWSNLKDFFTDLNKNCLYVILRNWESLQDEKLYTNGHEDIDILCSDLDKFILFTKAEKVHYLNTRNNYYVIIAKKKVRFDVRFVGDGYYDSSWEKRMLDTRILYSNFYVINQEHFLYALAYHALIQKKDLSDEYKNRIQELNGEKNIDENNLLMLVKDYFQANGYKATVPMDPGVIFNRMNAKVIGIERNFTKSLKRFLFRIKQKIGKRV